MNANETPRQIDTDLAALYTERYRLEDRYALYATSMKQTAGADFYYRGRQRVTDMTLDQAEAIIAADLEHAAEYAAANVTRDGSYVGTDWSSYTGRLAPHDIGRAQKSVDELVALRAQLDANHEAIQAREADYTGWSRFFLVTSSKGHIHSTTACSTCRPTTRFGWLPGLSGKSEGEAVEAHGPALCSVCFPSAPVEWTSEKITAAKATKAAA